MPQRLINTLKWVRRLGYTFYDVDDDGVWDSGKYKSTFKYNDSGIRTYKKYTNGTDTTTINYNLMGSMITYEERTGDNACELYYAYTSTGKLYGFYYDGAEKDGFLCCSLYILSDHIVRQ